MSNADFWRGIEVRTTGGSSVSSHGPVVARYFIWVEETYPRFSWYSVTLFTNSSCSSLRSIDSPRLGGIFVVLAARARGYTSHKRACFASRILTPPRHLRMNLTRKRVGQYAIQLLRHSTQTKVARRPSEHRPGSASASPCGAKAAGREA